jgi:simple sugar transport system ATP-binding protein
MRGIGKSYPGKRRPANSGISLDIRKGEILCLAGENGAGKSTLMKILCGLEQPSEGEILINGKPVKIHNPVEAGRLGIGMVHQHFMLFPEYTVAENVVMGQEPRRGIFYDTEEAEGRTAELITRHRFSISPRDRVGSLTVGQMQQTEICRTLYRNADIIILDEPTAVLTAGETDSLFDTLRALKESGRAVILITHKPGEIKRISDRVAALCRGRLTGLRESAGLSVEAISAMITAGTEPASTELAAAAPGTAGLGAEAGPETADRSRRERVGEEVIVFDRVTVTRPGQKQPLLKDLSFSVRAGEIIGFTGVSGNGLGVLEAVLGGFLHPVSGRILHKGRDISRFSIRRLRSQGLSFVPADRLRVGSAGEATVTENLILERRAEFSRRWIFNRGQIRRFSENLIRRYNIDGNGDDTLASLSGGNIQKVILARELDRFRDYMVFSEPTWGLDTASGNLVYREIRKLKEQGAALILISTNRDEILANADRVIVLYRGSAAAEFACTDPGAAEKTGACMLGLGARPSEDHE